MREPTVLETLMFIKYIFGNKRRDNGELTWMHSYRVMRGLGPDATDSEKIVALLHDVLEDTDITWTDLYYMGYSSEVIIAVRIMERKKGESYFFVYIPRICGNSITRKIKPRDINDNLELFDNIRHILGLKKIPKCKISLQGCPVKITKKDLRKAFKYTTALLRIKIYEKFH